MINQRCQNISLGTDTSLNIQQNIRKDPLLSPCFCMHDYCTMSHAVEQAYPVVMRNLPTCT